MSKQTLTPKREKFAQCVASGMVQADAYRRAYDCSNSTDKTVHEHASRLAANVKVRARIDELRKPVIAKVRYDLEQAMAECDEAIELAKETESASALVAAVQLKSKLNGLLVEDRRNQRRPFESLTDAQLDNVIEQKARDARVTLQ